jgi:excisionase family DNA binding protein
MAGASETHRRMPDHELAERFLDCFEELIERVAAKVVERFDTATGGPMRQRLLTVKQAAEVLGRSVPAVQHIISSGGIRVVKSDRRTFIDIRDLDAWIERSKIEP